MLGRWNSLECSSPCHGEDRGFKSRPPRQLGNLVAKIAKALGVPMEDLVK